MIEAGVVANGFSEMGGASGWNKNLDIAFKLMVSSPVESAQWMRTCGRDDVVGTEATT